MTKMIAAGALNALIDALTAVYWYKRDLKRFLTNTLSDASILARLNWDEPKRSTLDALVQYLAKDQARHQGDLVRLMTEAARVDDFSHLEALDDGALKAKKARAAVQALRAWIEPHAKVIEDARAASESIAMNRKTAEQQATFALKMGKLHQEYLDGVSSMVMTTQARGYLLERILRELFELFDLDPRAAFSVTGEQIDGAFTFDKSDYILEARWRKEPTAPSDLDVFAAKVKRRLDNTLGLFVSVSGFSLAAQQLQSRGDRQTTLLADGADLLAVLEGRVGLDKLLFRKRRRAAQTGEVFFPVAKMLTER